MGTRKYRSTIRERKNRPGRWVLDCRPWGPEITGFKGEAFSSKCNAERVRGHIERGLAIGLDPDDALAPFVTVAQKRRAIQPRLEAWLEEREQDYELGEISKTHMISVRQYARQYFIYWSEKDLSAINHVACKDFGRWLISEFSISQATANRVIGVWRGFMRWLEEREEIVRAPRIHMFKLSEHKPQILEPAQQAAVLAAIPLESRGIFLALAHGLRHSEARALDLEDFSVRQTDGRATGFLSVSKGFDGSSAADPITGTKNKLCRDVPISDELRTWIEKKGRRDRIAGPLFLNPEARNIERRWTNATIRRAWIRACDAARVPRVGSYEGTKHSTATKWLAEGTQLETIQAIFGQKSSASTRHYAKVRQKSMIDAVRRCDQGATGDE